MDTTRAACADNSYPYDVLIDFKVGPEHTYALHAALKTCGDCPIRDTCLLDENKDEEWAQKIVAAWSAIKTCANPPCGNKFVVNRQGPTRRWCSDNCSSEARRAARNAA